MSRQRPVIAPRLGGRRTHLQKTRLHLDPERLDDLRCETGKLRYATHDEALDAAERQMERGQVDPGCHVTPYACDACGGHHIGNKRIVQVPTSQRRGRWARRRT